MWTKTAGIKNCKIEVKNNQKLTMIHQIPISGNKTKNEISKINALLGSPCFDI